jgi:hypothetical protein
LLLELEPSYLLELIQEEDGMSSYYADFAVMSSFFVSLYRGSGLIVAPIKIAHLTEVIVRGGRL